MGNPFKEDNGPENCLGIKRVFRRLEGGMILLRMGRVGNHFNEETGPECSLG